MKRVFTALCVASAFAIGLSAQQSTTAASQDAQQGQRGPRSVTLTGCLRAGDTAGTYMLTDVTGLPAMGRRGGGDTTAAAGATTSGGTESGTQAAPGTSVMLNPAADVDLAPHVGHKIEVTGTMGGGRGRRGGAGATAGGTDTTAAGATTTAGGQGQGRGRGMMRSVIVTSVRMISDSCS